MSKILDAVTAKINQLDDVCSKIDSKICIGHGDDVLLIPAPPTDVGRALLRALLVEIRRLEIGMIESQLQIFETAACRGLGEPQLVNSIVIRSN